MKNPAPISMVPASIRSAAGIPTCPLVDLGQPAFSRDGEGLRPAGGLIQVRPPSKISGAKALKHMEERCHKGRYDASLPNLS